VIRILESMKAMVCSAVAVSLVLVSCSSNDDPDYEAYKKQQQGAPYGPSADPYGAEAVNPYAVPGADSEVGAYEPLDSGQRPRPQPLPDARPQPAPTPLGAAPAPDGSFPTIPSEDDAGTGAPSRTTTHVVKTGDSLWGLARRYGTTVEAIKAANGLTSNTILTGTTLKVPTR